MSDTTTPIQTIVQTSHAEQILSIAVSPDGRYLASVSAGDSAVKLWDIKTGILIRNFAGHTGWGQAAAFSPDGKSLLSGAWDGTARLWEVESGRCLHTYLWDHVNAVCFAPNNKIITAGNQGLAYLWELDGGQPIRSFQGHTAAILSISLSKNGRFLATGSKDGTAKLWDLNNPKNPLLHTFRHSGPDFVHAVVIDPADAPQYLLTAASTSAPNEINHQQTPQTLKLWDLKNPGKADPLDTYAGHSGNIFSAAISPDGRFLASAGQENSILLWDLKNKGASRPLHRLEGHTHWVSALCFSPGGQFLASGGYDKAAKWWDIKQQKEVRTFSGHSGIVYASAISPNGQFLFEGGEGNTINVWDLAKGERVDSLNQEEAKQFPLIDILALDISPDGKYLAWGSNNTLLQVWDFDEKKLVQRLQLTHRVSSVRFSEDGKILAAGSDDGNACYLEMGKEEPVWLPKQVAIWGCRVDVNAQRGILAASYDHNHPDEPDLILFDLKNNRQLVLPHHPERVRAIRLSRDGRLLASACHDGIIRVWDLTYLENPQFINEFHELNWVESIDISLDNRFILSGSRDNNVRLWDMYAEGMEPVRVFSGHTSEVYASFSPNGQYVVTNSKDSTTKVWETHSGKEVAMFVSMGEKEWAALTPSGLFDASQEAMKMMHYVVGLEVIELDQLKGRYWQPGLLPILMGFSKGQLMDVDKIARPEFYPKVESIKLEGNVLKVELEECHYFGRTSLRINNKELEPDINPDRKLKFSFSIAPYKRFFEKGKNTLAIRSWNSEDWLPSPFYELEFLSDEGNTGDGEASLYAIFVGTSKYKNDSLSLAFPDKDAAYLSDAVRIVGEHLFPKRVHIKLLTTDKTSAGEFSSKENIKKAFKEFAAKAKPQDVVVIYFTGHGINFSDGQKALYYYLTNGVINDNLSDSAVREKVTLSSDELTSWLNDIPANKQVLILDTCFSGKVVDSLKSKNAVDATRDRAMERMKDRTGTYVLTGSAADKVSYEASSYGQGLLTYTLLQGMKGLALAQRVNQPEKSVDVMTLFTFAREEVERLSSEFFVVQKPTLRAPLNVESFDIGIAPEEARRQIKLAIPKPVFVQSNFMNSKHYLDDLGLSETLDQYLAGSIGIGNRPPAIFIDIANFPGAHSVRGLYVKNGGRYKVKGRVYKDQTSLGDLAVEGKSAEDIVPKISRIVEQLAFVLDDDAVPTDEEIGVLEKSLSDDLEAIKGKPVFGYDENFIGPNHKVPLPTLNARQKKDIAVTTDNETVLKYQYYSVVQCKSRKFPYFAACNLHGGQFIRRERAGAFIRDPRLPREDQWGDELYTSEFQEGLKYSSFCHRGHMAKREDPQWGPDEDTAERGARLTFFFTNAIPQHGHLNGVVWRGLEDYIMDVATDGKKASGPDIFKINILTGPVFQDDDPLFPIKNDGKEENVKVPALFWKIVYFRKKDDGKLYYTGFMMGQKELLKTEFKKHGILAKDAAIKKEPAPFQEYKDKEVFQVQVAFIEEKTNLKFHPAEDPLKGTDKGRHITEVVKKKSIGGELPYSLEGLTL